MSIDYSGVYEMKQVIVGVYDLGYQKIQLILREGTGADWQTLPKNGDVSQMSIGVDRGIWSQIFRSLMHESLELSIFLCHCRYYQNNDVSDGNDLYMMVMDHGQFGQVSAQAAEFICACQNDLSRAWKAWHRPPKKKPAKKRKAK
ncbi:hypothetical protein LCGC14_1105560 [marine sediment metagenome]|uniref:Uncharacterized protein n=1 Tax=marine sediment metagenome TaxID=412755 RepID=A0A0F9MW89_9ZZZZ